MRCLSKNENIADRVKNNLIKKFINILDKKLHTERKKKRKIDTKKQVNGLRDEVNTDRRNS
jgi:hypothetical protein